MNVYTYFVYAVAERFKNMRISPIPPHCKAFLFSLTNDTIQSEKKIYTRKIIGFMCCVEAFFCFVVGRFHF